MEPVRTQPPDTQQPTEYTAEQKGAFQKNGSSETDGIFPHCFNGRTEMKKINRQKKQVPRGHSSWCPSCDRARVNDGQKCHVCKHVKQPKRNKP